MIKKVENNNKKGFTLIEVLAVIVIIAIVTSVSYVVYINTINNSKEKSLAIAQNNVKKSAEVFSKESSDIKWIKLNEDRQYACITILDLINAGYLKQDFFKDDLYKDSDISNNSYIKISRDNYNKANFKVSLLDSSVDSVDKCQLEVVNEENKDTNIQIYSPYLYSDTIILPIQEEGNYNCYVNGNLDADAFNPETNECIFTGLNGDNQEDGKYGGTFDTKICFIDNSDNCFESSHNLSEFVTTIEYDPDTNNENAYRNVSINYNDDMIYNKPGFHYFKSDVSSETGGDINLSEGAKLYLCQGNDLINVVDSTCTTEASSIVGGNIYKIVVGADVSNIQIEFTIRTNVSINDNFKVHSLFKDETGNYLLTNEKIPPINTTVSSCNISLVGNIGNNNYYTSNVTVNLNKGEKNGITATSYGLVAGGSNDKPVNSNASLTQSSDTTGTTYYGYVKYSNGTESKCKASVKVDKTKPTVPTSSIKLDNEYVNQNVNGYNADNKWTNKEIWWGDFNATDATSGIAKYEYYKVDTKVTNTLRASYTYNNKNYQFKIRSVDKAGNVSAWGELYYFKTDNTAPSCDIVNTKYASYNKDNTPKYSNEEGTYNSGSWYSGYVKSYATCKDSLSGCNTYITVTGAATALTDSKKTERGVVTEGTSKFKWVAKDNAGNSKNCGTTTIKLDRSKPTCNVSMIKSKDTDYTKTYNYDGSWYSGYARSIPECDDNINETNSGCMSSHTVVVDATHSNATAGTFTKKKSRGVEAEGDTKHIWTISDKAGNSRTCPAVDIKLDRSAPSCTASKSNLYTTTGVTASFSCSDNPSNVYRSGVDSCTATKTGLKSNSSYAIKDNAGNSGTCSVSVTPYTQYSRRTRSSWWDDCATGSNTCQGGYDYGSWGDCSVPRDFVPTSSSTECAQCNPNLYKCRSKIYNSCKTGRNTCQGGTKYGSWSGYSAWSSDNHCSNYTNSSTCEQQSRTAYQ